MSRFRTIHRVARLTDLLLRLGILTPDEEKDIREKIAKLGSHQQSKQS